MYSALVLGKCQPPTFCLHTEPKSNEQNTRLKSNTNTLADLDKLEICHVLNLPTGELKLQDHTLISLSIPVGTLC